MNKRWLHLMIIAMLLLAAIPGHAWAASSRVTIADIASKVPGDTITITGSSDYPEVIIKLITPNNTVLYYDVAQTSDGTYSVSIKLPAAATLGMYTAAVGQGTDVASDQFEVKAASTSGGSTGGGGGGSTSTTTTSNSQQITAAEGGQAALNGAVINIPASAFDSNLRITVVKVADVSQLPVPTEQLLASDVFEITKDKSGNFLKPVTITLPISLSGIALTTHRVAIAWLDEAKGIWVPLENQQIDWTKRTLSGTVNHFTKFAVLSETLKTEPDPSTPVLTDISGHWAAAPIQKLVALGAISGYPDGTFKPNNNITRAEFVSVLTKAYKLEAKGSAAFGDVTSHWAKDAIAAAVEAGIVNGYSAERFGPNDLITREQMAVMIAKAAKLSDAADESSFTDSANIAVWAQPAVAAVASQGIMSGYQDGSLRPKGLATRAEAATVILKALSLK